MSDNYHEEWVVATFGHGPIENLALGTEVLGEIDWPDSIDDTPIELEVNGYTYVREDIAIERFKKEV